MACLFPGGLLLRLPGLFRRRLRRRRWTISILVKMVLSTPVSVSLGIGFAESLSGFPGLGLVSPARCPVLGLCRFAWLACRPFWLLPCGEVAVFVEVLSNGFWCRFVVFDGSWLCIAWAMERPPWFGPLGPVPASCWVSD